MRLLLLLTFVTCAPKENALPSEPNVVVIPSASTTQPAETIAAPTPTVPPSVTNATPGSDPRDLRPQTRSQTLVVGELQALTQLLSATQKTSPDRPKLMQRTGDAAAELRKSTSDPKVALAASRQAIGTYQQVITEYPTFTNLDAVRYYLGLEYEKAGDAANARRTYYELIKNSPSSAFIPLAYFAFGELFLAEARSDPSKWPLTEQAYLEAIKYPQTTILPEALLRLGQVRDAQGNSVAAQQMYARLRKDFPSSDAASRIGQKP